MKTLLTSALIIATLSGAAFAASPVAGVSAGEAQLALAAGVQPGDVLLAINGAPAKNIEQVRAAMAKAGKSVALLIARTRPLVGPMMLARHTDA